jgi:hypothetical protein
METAPIQNTPPVQRTMLPGPVQLLKDSIHFYKNHFKMIFGIMVVPFVLSLLTLFINSETSPALSAIVSLAYGVISFVAYLALLQSVVDNNSTVGAGSAYSKAFTILLPSLLIMLITTLTSMGGFALLIIPGIYLSILLCFALYVFIDEKKEGMSAAVQSWHYVQGYWWPVFGRLLFIGLVGLVVIIILGIVGVGAGIGKYGTDTANIAANAKEISMVGTVINNLVQVFVFTPINIIFVFFIYQALKSIKTNTVEQTEEVKIRKNIKIFMIIGVIAIIAAVGLASYGAATFFKRSGSLSIPSNQPAAAILTPLFNMLPSGK